MKIDIVRDLRRIELRARVLYCGRVFSTVRDAADWAMRRDISVEAWLKAHPELPTRVNGTALRSDLPANAWRGALMWAGRRARRAA